MGIVITPNEIMAPPSLSWRVGGGFSRSCRFTPYTFALPRDLHSYDDGQKRAKGKGKGTEWVRKAGGSFALSAAQMLSSVGPCSVGVDGPSNAAMAPLGWPATTLALATS